MNGLQGVEQAIADGMRDAGLKPRPDSIYVFRNSSGLVCFYIRLNADGDTLPSMSCIVDHISNGSVKEGTVIGAKTMIVGCIQQAGNQTRTAAREVDVETGVIQDTGKGDAAGTDGKSIRESAGSAFKAFKGNMS
ncbi:MAG TPA: hypothetical protein VGB26_12385 [Nitrospiria bacterium]